MGKTKIDPSLEEVRRWRGELQEELGLLTPEGEAKELNRRAKALIRQYDLKVKTHKIPDVA